MPRHRKVNKEIALQRALSAFWTHGYHQLGVRALEEATGINRFALQKDYGGKTGLFLLVLDHYLRFSENAVFHSVAHGGLEEIATLFLLRASDTGLPEETRCGCLAINTACDNDGENEDINQRIDAFFQLIRHAFSQALTNEQARGTLKEHLDIPQASEFLRAELIGLNVTAKTYGSNSACLAAATFTADIVRSWKK